MAALNTQKLVVAGTKPNFDSASASDTAEVGKGVFAVYRNSHATEAATVTVVVPGDTDYGQDNPDVEYTVPAVSGEVWVPLTYAAYRGDDGRATINADSGTVTVAVVKVA
jgi:hypothetical protein